MRRLTAQPIEPCRISAGERDASERRGDEGRVGEFCGRSRCAAIGHRSACMDDQPQAAVGIGFEFADRRRSWGRRANEQARGGRPGRTDDGRRTRRQALSVSCDGRQRRRLRQPTGRGVARGRCFPSRWQSSRGAETAPGAFSTSSRVVLARRSSSQWLAPTRERLRERRVRRQ